VNPTRPSLRVRWTFGLAAAAIAVGLAGAAAREATALPTGFTDTFVASVESPTALAFTPDGRLLVTTQFGELRVIDGSSPPAPPALDLGGVLCTADEMGLLGVAVDPAFSGSGFVYLYYTRSKSGRCVNRVSRFSMAGATISAASGR
jgi:glucose/arabinose dehydrogenase